MLKTCFIAYTPAMKRPRFKLVTLLAVTAAFADILGYTQVRRRHLNREFAALSASGCPSAFEDRWFWPTAPESMGVMFHADSNDRLSLGSEAFTRVKPLEATRATRVSLT
ncbi:MAG: hypothetical protein C0485_05530 [Pirellula sp.]|nr:hypothetical protein [Pirellula sp.]